MGLAQDKSRRSHQTQRAEGLAFARAWRAQRHPVAATDPYPFKGHKTCADWAQPE